MTSFNRQRRVCVISAACALYQGKAGDAAGNCPLFAGKMVSSKGWCSAWVKKG